MRRRGVDPDAGLNAAGFNTGLTANPNADLTAGLTAFLPVRLALAAA